MQYLGTFIDTVLQNTPFVNIEFITPEVDNVHMNEIWQKMKNADSKVQLVVLAIVVLLVIIIGFNRFDGDDSGRKISASDRKDLEGNVPIDLNNDGEVMDGDSVNNTAGVVSGLAQFTNVKVALLAGPVFEGKVPGKKRSCDTVVMVNKNITRTPAPLGGALKEIFTSPLEADFSPGNFIATQDKLSFNEVRIENGVAKVFISGEMGPIAGDCDADRVKIQIEETAFQFSTVKSVEVYLNGEMI